jgi:hypothetical protein
MKLWGHVSRQAVDANAGRDSDHRAYRLTVRDDIDLLSEHQARVEIVHVNGRAGESLDKMKLDGRQSVLASEVPRDARGDGVKLLSRAGTAVECVPAQQA